MECTMREKTLTEYIEYLGNPELTHDYKGETQRILELLKKQERETNERHYREVRALEAQIAEKNTIISCLASNVQMLNNRI